MESSFKKVVEENKNKVFNTAFGFLKNREDAEDITQDVFIEAWRKMNTFNQQSEITTWLYRITINKCIDFKRKQNRRNLLGKIISVFNFSYEHEQLSKIQFDPGIQLEEKELAIALQFCMEKLSSEYQSIIVLTKYEKLSYKQVGKILNISEKAVESKVYRAKDALQKELKKYFNE